MTLTSHPDFPRLLRISQTLVEQATAWRGEVYRFASPQFASPSHLVSGEGSRLYGARWNAPGSFRAVYASLEPETPLKETQAHAQRYGFPLARRLPLTLDELRADLQVVLDLTSWRIRKRLRISARRIRDERWWDIQDTGCEALTQAIGRAAYTAGFEGMLVPSVAAWGAVNLIIFPDNLRSGSQLLA